MKEIIEAFEAYRRAETIAVGYAYGKRASDLRKAKKRLEQLLWAHHETIVNLIRKANP